MINRFQKWLARFPTKTEAVVLIIGLPLANLLWLLLVAYIYFITGTAPEPPLNPSIPFNATIVAFLTAAIIEEPLFRIIPLTLALREWSVGSGTMWTLAISSVLFGLIHGDVRNVLLQGVMGCMLGVLFIKFSDQGKRPILAGSIVIATHFAFNVIIYFIIVLGKFLAPL